MAIPQLLLEPQGPSGEDTTLCWVQLSPYRAQHALKDQKLNSTWLPVPAAYGGFLTTQGQDSTGQQGWCSRGKWGSPGREGRELQGDRAMLLTPFHQ